MRLSQQACLLTALASACQVLADVVAAEATRTVSEAPELITPDAGAVDLMDLYGNHVDLKRQAAGINLNNQAATQAATQAPAVTTFYINKAVGNTVTYAAVVYTQTFADVPDQWPSPIAGTIGLGDLVKQGNGKRDAPPKNAGIAGRIGR